MRDNLVFSGIRNLPKRTQKLRLKLYQDIPEASGRHRGKHASKESIGWERRNLEPRGRVLLWPNWILQAERAGEESRQGAERNRLQRKRPVPQRNPGATQNLFPIRRSLIQKGSRAVIAVDRLYVDGSSTATSVPLRGYINTTPDKSVIFSFFFSLSSLVLPFTSNYLLGVQRIIDDP